MAGVDQVREEKKSEEKQKEHEDWTSKSFEELLGKEAFNSKELDRLNNMLANYVKAYIRKINDERTKRKWYAASGAITFAITLCFIIPAAMSIHSAPHISSISVRDWIEICLGSASALYGVSNAVYFTRQVMILNTKDFQNNVSEFRDMAKAELEKGTRPEDLMEIAEIRNRLNNIIKVIDIVPVSDDALFLSHRMDHLKDEMKEEHRITRDSIVEEIRRSFSLPQQVPLPAIGSSAQAPQSEGSATIVRVIPPQGQYDNMSFSAPLSSSYSHSSSSSVSSVLQKDEKAITKISCIRDLIDEIYPSEDQRHLDERERYLSQIVEHEKNAQNRLLSPEEQGGIKRLLNSLVTFQKEHAKQSSETVRLCS